MAKQNALNNASSAFTINDAYTFPTADGNADDVLTTDGAGSVTWQPVSGGGFPVQQVYSQTASIVNCSTVMPMDSTIPQSSEGTQVLTATITPTSATNYLIIEFSYNGQSTGSPSWISSAIFQDATANALFADAQHWDNICSTYRSFRMTSGTTSSTTFKLRVGQSTTGNFYVNGLGPASVLFGGVSLATLMITEIQA